MKKIKLSVIADPDFAWALSNLMNAAVPAKAAYWLAKIFKKVQSHEKTLNETRLTVLKKYCELNDKGELVTEEKGEAKFKNADCKDQFLKEMKELLEQEVEVPTVKFALFGDDSKLETRILVILEDIIEQD